MNPLEDLQAMCRVRSEVEQQVEILAERALRNGADRSAIAATLGISRSHLYRLYAGRLCPTLDDSPPATADASQQ